MNLKDYFNSLTLKDLREVVIIAIVITPFFYLAYSYGDIAL